MDLFNKRALQEARAEIDLLKQELKQVRSQLKPEQITIMQLEQEINRLQGERDKVKKEVQVQRDELQVLRQEINEKRKNVIELEEEALYQSFSLYKPMYDFSRSELYKERLDDIRRQQKDMIKEEKAVNYPTGWSVNGSKADGTKLMKNTVKQVLRLFNTECENVIDRVNFANIESMQTRIKKLFDDINKLNAVHQVSITQAYYESKIRELHLAYEWAVKKEEEKEEEKIRKEELKEQARVEKEILEEKKKLEKEKQHFVNYLNSIPQDKELTPKEVEMKEKLAEVEKQIADTDYRVANQKAGYVYVASNIGSFGEDVYKIGMTRRLEPEDRISELNTASVPFKFNTHAMIFTDDAPALETALHKAFDDYKVNKINNRKEFFEVNLEEIKRVVKANFDKEVEFVDIPAAEDYRQSLQYNRNK